MRKAMALTAAVVAGAAIVTGSGGSAVAQDDVSAAANGFYRTTTYLNLRTGPGTGYSVIRVMPPNTLLAGIGPEQNGFIKVADAGQVGWASAQYLTSSNGGSTDTPVGLGTKWTTAAVNMRQGPGQGYPVIRVLPQNTVVNVYDNFMNNYQLISFNGQFGWVSLDYLSATGGQNPSTLQTTTALNLRSQPSLSASILKVLPAGTYVQAGDQVVNGFRQVTHNGVTGWAYDAFLA
jgi:N-acetylmuramoyl-L-alanine amidase